MGRPIRLTLDLVCAHCLASIRLPATVVSWIAGDQVRTYHASCHRAAMRAF